MYFVKNKRSKHDRCNICSIESDLTWDHIPPKFCNNDNAKRYMVALGMYESGYTRNPYHLTVQNGIKFRSICAHCNNNLLGLNVDPAYKKLVDCIVNLLQQEAPLKGVFHVTTAVNRVARAVVGHLLASKNYYDDKCTIDKRLRKYFLNSNLCPPAGMQLYYFLYPYDAIMVLRDVVPIQPGGVPKEFIVPQSMISSIYSFPVAFLLTEGCSNLPFEDLFQLCNEFIDTSTDMAFSVHSLTFPNTKTFRHPYWPCNITDTIEGAAGVLGGKSAQDIVMAKGK